MKPLLVAVAAAVVVGGLVFVAVIAARPDPEATPSPQEVFGRTMSPFCPGITLAECNTNQSSDLKVEIEAKVEQGWTNAQIDGWLVDTYDQKVLGRPGGAGVWVAPLVAAGVAAGAGGAFAAFAIRAKRPAPASDLRASSEELARVQQELDQFGMGTE